MGAAEDGAPVVSDDVPAPNTALWRIVGALPSLEQEMLALRTLVPAGGVCLDVGASYGSYSVLLARLVGPSGTVHALEPRRRSRLVLRAASRIAAPGNVHIHELALADGEGEAELLTPRRRWGLPVPGRSFLVDRHDDGSGCAHEYGGGARLQRVRRTTLDTLVEELALDRVDLLKIDVEGAELAVLNGGEGTLGTHRPVILSEIEDRHTRRYGHGAEEVFAWLAERGWVAHVYDRRGLREVAGPVGGHINYLFTPQG